MTAWTSFTDGVVVHQAGLNNLSTNGDSLCQITTGKTSASGVSSKPICEVHLTSNKSIANSADTLISWDATGYNTDNMWVGSVPTQITVQTAGKYRISVTTDWAPNVTGARLTKILVNGTANANSVATTQTGANPVAIATAYSTVYTAALAAGATIFVDVLQNSGGALNLEVNTNGSGGCSICVEWMAP